MNPDGLSDVIRRTASPQKPWIDLLFIGLFFLDWFYTPPSPAEAGLSFAAIAAFLGAYVFAMRRLGWTVLAAAAFAIALGYALIPYNVGGAVFVVFGAGMTARMPDRRFREPGLVAVGAVILAAGLAMGHPYLMILALLGLAGFVALSAGWSARAGEREARSEARRADAERAAAEAERGRIARDLHDLLGHSLSVIALKADLADRLFDKDQAASRAELAEIRSISRSALSEVREAVSGLKPRSLTETLSDIAARLEAAGMDVALDVAAEDPPKPAALILSMAAREAATNILRHAEARSARIRLRTQGGALTLTVEDDGRGGVIEGGGLTGLRARLDEAGGRLTLSSGAEGRGVRLEAVLPLDKGGQG